MNEKKKAAMLERLQERERQAFVDALVLLAAADVPISVVRISDQITADWMREIVMRNVKTYEKLLSSSFSLKDNEDRTLRFIARTISI
jgi:hypothetical protein